MGEEEEGHREKEKTDRLETCVKFVGVGGGPVRGQEDVPAQAALREL